MILLIVLGVLVIFALAVLMFVISARQHKTSAQAQHKVERYDDDFGGLLNQGLSQLLKGTRIPSSVLREHNLLEDLYGNDSLPASTNDPALPLALNAQVIQDSTGSASGLLLLTAADPANRLSPAAGYYNGRVLTALDGQARMHSTRIVGYQFVGGQGRFQVLAFDNGALPQQADRILINGREFNGVGFGYNPANGTTQMSDPDYSFPAALLPNTAADRTARPFDLAGGGGDEPYDAPDYNNMALAGRFWIPPSPNGAGLTVRDRNGQNVTIPEHLCGRWIVLLPSFHRPDLINWMVSNSGGQAGNWLFRRKYILRPLSDGPNVGFDGETNPGPGTKTDLLLNPDQDGNGILDMLETGRLLWDVDNDGDGLVDSVWIDLGLPVQTAPDGRQFKPLFAFLVLDMDNRLNLNAISGNHHANQANVGLQIVNSEPVPGTWFATLAGQVGLPQGQGNSPARVNARVIFSQAEWAQLLSGVGPTASESAKDGRNGDRDRAASSAPAFPGLTDGLRDAASFVKDPRYPQAYGPVDAANLLGKPIIDLVSGGAGLGYPVSYSEMGMLGLDPHGQPIRINFGPSHQFEVEHPPQFFPYRERYLGSGGQRKAMDAPFTMADVEELLRRYDVDAQSLHRRLRRLAPDLWREVDPMPQIQALLRQRQGMVTAESYDLPVGAPTPSKQIRDAMLANNVQPTGNHIVDLVAFKIISEYTLPGQPAPSNALIAASLPLLLSPEVARGERMNVNRPLGNGRDDNNNLIVDEPGEANAAGAEAVWWGTGDAPPWDAASAPPTHSQFVDVPMNYANGQDLNGDGVYTPADDALASNAAFRLHAQVRARQLYARHLYVLMMLVMDRAYVVPTNSGLGLPDQKKYTAQRVAQWAVNVVDYLDGDSISTPFEFDYEPFVENGGSGSTWNVDGWIGTIPAGVPGLPGAGNASPDDQQNYRGLVWGCERPQLLLTETFGYHDLRTEDRADEDPPGVGEVASRIGAGAMDDKDRDQKRRPQSGVFLELYNPWHDAVPAEFRSLTLGLNNNAVDLSRLAPPSTDATLTPQQRQPRPVWQIVLRRQATDWSQNPDTKHLDPQFPQAHVNAEAERIVWFTSEQTYGSQPHMTVDDRIYYTRLENWPAPTTDAEYIALQTGKPNGYEVGWENKVGFDSTAANMAQMCLVGPGRYAVIGPRVRTRIGRSGSGATPTNHTIQLLDDAANSPQTPASLVLMQNHTYPPWTGGNPHAIKRPAGIVINYPRPLSMSEFRIGDANYYPLPDQVTADPDNASIKYVDAYVKTFDDPQDQAISNTYALGGGVMENMTVYLQRLANPLLPWHPDTNPYLTVDYMPLSRNRIQGEGDDVYGPNNEPKPDTTVRFTTYERTGYLADPMNPNTSATDYNVWKQCFSDPARADMAGRAQSNFAHSLGFLSGLSTGANRANVYLGRGGVWTSTDFAPGSAYIGDPRSEVFPWFTWNDHPVASHLELMNVPASSPSRLLYEHQLRIRGATSSYFNHYLDRRSMSDEYGPRSPGPPFGHLLNFFHSSSVDSDLNDGWNDNTRAAGNFFRALEFLRVPSRFEGSEIILNPQQFLYALNDPSGAGPLLHNFFPPFNRLSRYRDPGLININTIGDDGLTWQAILDNDGLDAAGYHRNHLHWRKVFLSRQGYGSLPATNEPLVPMLNIDSPTMYANPFRAYADGYNVPIPALRNDNASPGGSARQLVDATLLRPDPYDPNRSRPLLGVQATLDTGGDPTLAGDGRSTSGDPAGDRHYLDADRNPYFRYDTLNKLGNVITTRSNVYGVWITVGYFEVKQDPSLPRSICPDGYKLGAELGSDTGEVVRHRMFAVIDRSIPVAFQRGEDYNSQKAVVLKKIIE